MWLRRLVCIVTVPTMDLPQDNPSGEPTRNLSSDKISRTSTRAHASQREVDVVNVGKTETPPVKIPEMEKKEDIERVLSRTSTSDWVRHTILGMGIKLTRVRLHGVDLTIRTTRAIGLLDENGE